MRVAAVLSLLLILALPTPCRAQESLAAQVQRALDHAGRVGQDGGGLVGRIETLPLPNEPSADPAVIRDAREAARELEDAIRKLMKAKALATPDQTAAIDETLTLCLSELRRVRTVAGDDPDAPIAPDPVSPPPPQIPAGGGIASGGSGSGGANRFGPQPGFPPPGGRGGSEGPVEGGDPALGGGPGGVPGIEGTDGLSLPPRDESGLGFGRPPAEDEGAGTEDPGDDGRDEPRESRRPREARPDGPERDEPPDRPTREPPPPPPPAREADPELQGDLASEMSLIYPGRIVVVPTGDPDESAEETAERVDEALLAASSGEPYQAGYHEIWLVALPEDGTPIRLRLDGPPHRLQRVGDTAGGTANIRGRVTDRASLPDDLGDIGILHVEEVISVQAGW